MINNKIMVISLQLILCFILSVSTTVFAEDNIHNYNEIFKLDEEQSSIKEGDIDIPIDSVIKLVFTKNISNGQEIIDINKSCITMMDENKNLIDIDVNIKDSNIAENTQDKNNIYVRPIKSLEKGKKYTIMITDSLQTDDYYSEKQLPISLNFNTVLEDESQAIEENTIDKNTLIEKLKQALEYKYIIKLEEKENNKVIIIISNEEGSLENKYTYIGTLEEVKEIITKFEAEMNESENKPKDEVEDYPNEDYENQDQDTANKDDVYRDEKIDKNLHEDDKDDEDENITDDNKYELINNPGVSLVLCIFMGISMYKIYFS